MGREERCTPANDDTQSRIQELERQIARLETELDALRSGVDSDSTIMTPPALLNTDRIISLLPNYIMIYDALDERLVYGNWRDTFVGYTTEEMMQMGGALPAQLVHPDDFPAVQEHIRNILKSDDGSVHIIEFRIRHKDGSWHWFRAKDSLFSRDEDGRGRQILAMIDDVTEQRSDESALKALLNQPMAGIMLTQGNVLLLANETAANILGLTADELMELSPEQFWSGIHPDYREMVRSSYQARIRGSDAPDQFEFKLVRPDGITIWIEVFTALIDYRGSVTELSFLIDITDRKKAEERLAEREQRLSSLFNHSLDAIIIAADDGHYTEVNPAACELYGFPAEEMIGKTYADFMPEQHKARWPKVWRKFLERGHDEGIFPIHRPDGTVRHAEYRATAHFIPGRHVSFLRDVTERVQIERALQESEQAFKTLAENSPDLIARVDRDMRYSYVNPAWLDSTPHKLDEVIGKRTSELPIKAPKYVAMNKEVTERWEPVRRQVIESGETQSITFSSNEFGDVQHYHATIVPEFDKQGRVQSVLSITRDITEIRAIEEQLRESERAFKTLAENSPDRIARVDRDLRYTYVNPAWLNHLNLLREFVVGKATGDLDLPSDLIRANSIKMEASRRKVLETGEATTFNYQSEYEGKTIHFNALLVPELDDTGDVQSVLSIARDITEVRAIEEQLRESERAFKTLAENSPDRIARTDRDLRFLYANPAWLKYMRQTLDDIIGRRLDELEIDGKPVPAANIERWERARRAVAETGESTTINFQSPLSNRPNHLHSTLVPEFDDEGNVQSVLSVTHDVTESKIAEEALRESERAFKSLAENIPDMIARFDPNLRYIYVNPAWIAGSSFTNEEVIGRRTTELPSQTPEEAERLKQVNARWEPIRRRVIETGQAETIDISPESESGDKQHYQVSLIPEFDEQNEVESLLSIFRDVTESRVAEEQLRESERAFKSLAENSPDMIARVDRNLRYIYVNPAWIENSLFAAYEDVIGRRISELQDKISNDGVRIKEYTDRWDPARRKVIKTGQPETINFSSINDSGETQYYHATLVPEFDEAGRAQSVLSITRDITDTKAIEEQLRESERAFKSLAENIPDNITRVDRDLNYLYVNPSFATSIGKSPEELIGTSSVTSFPESELVKQWEQARRQVIETGQPAEMKFTVDELDPPRHFHALLVPEFDEAGQVQSVLSVNRDVSEAKNAEDALRESEAFVRRVTDAVPYIIVVFDLATGQKVFANRYSAEFFGLSQDQLKARDQEQIRASFHPDDLEKVSQLTQNAISGNGGKLHTAQCRMRRDNGEWRWMQYWLTPFRQSPEGKVQQLLGIAQDITEQRQAERSALRLAIEEHRVKELADFMLAASHEFRTPLSSINTILFMMERGNKPENTGRYIERLKESSGQILALVEALLQIAELDTVDTLDKSPRNLSLLLHSITDAYESLARQQQIQLELSIEDNLPKVPCHEQYLTIALNQLLDNALRYSPDGGSVHIQAQQHLSYVDVTIRDEGTGIPIEAQSRIFQRFFRRDEARSTPGLGLGLPIAHRIVQLHGGQITFESVPEVGSAFTLRLPLQNDGE